MDIETESQKKKLGGGVFGDVHPHHHHGIMMTAITTILPKDLVDFEKMEIDHHPITPPAPLFQLRFQLPDPRLAIRDLVRTREVGEFLSGALAGAMTKAVLAPLETIRTRMVVGVGSKNIAGSFFEIIEQQGWQGLWAGNAINMLRIIPTQAIEFGTFECVKRTMTSAQEEWKQNGCPNVQIGPVSLNFSLSWISPVAVAGAAAGIVSTIACHPLEVLKVLLPAQSAFH